MTGVAYTGVDWKKIYLPFLAPYCSSKASSDLPGSSISLSFYSSNQSITRRCNHRFNVEVNMTFSGYSQDTLTFGDCSS